MPLVVLAEGEGAGVRQRQRLREAAVQVLLAVKRIDAARHVQRHPTAMGIDPGVVRLALRRHAGARADEQRARGAERDHIVGIDVEIVRGARIGGILHVAAHHPVEGVGIGDVLGGLAEAAAIRCGAALAGGRDEPGGETFVIRHRHQRGLAVARMAEDGDAGSIHVAVGFQVIQHPAGAPGPGAKRPPVGERTGLAPVGEADDAGGEAGAIVGLHAGRVVDGIAPAALQNLQPPVGRGIGRRRHAGREDKGAQIVDGED